MLSGYYALVFATRYNRFIAALVFLMGVAMLLVAVMWLSTAPMFKPL
ncbi:hypothetical protein [Ruegeria lacuscaerulensis]